MFVHSQICILTSFFNVFACLVLIFIFILLQSTSSPVSQNSKKKTRVKRRLDFCAADYKSKKKIRVKSDLIISVTPVNDSNTSSDDQVTSDEEVEISFEVLLTRI